MESRTIGCSAGSQSVEFGIHQPLPSVVALGLIDNGHHAGEDGRGKTSASGDGEVLVVGIAETVGAAPSDAGICAVAGAVEIASIIGRSIQRNVRDEAEAASGGDTSNASLPGWTRRQGTDATATRGKTVSGAVIVPYLFGDVGERGADDVGGSLCGKVGIVTCSNISSWKLRATQTGDILTAGRKVDGESFLLSGAEDGRIIAGAIGRSIVTSG